MEIREGAPSQSALGAMYLFGSFRRSDRLKLKSLLGQQGGEDVFVESLQMFVDRWDVADWIEAYNVERVAKWCSIHLSRSLLDRLDDTFATVRKVKTGGQDAYGIFLNELRSWRSKDSADMAEDVPSAHL